MVDQGLAAFQRSRACEVPGVGEQDAAVAGVVKELVAVHGEVEVIDGDIAEQSEGDRDSGCGRSR